MMRQEETRKDFTMTGQQQTLNEGYEPENKKKEAMANVSKGRSGVQ